MKKAMLIIVLFIVSLIIFAPTEISAATKEFYIAKDSDHVSSGIYFADPNEQANPLVTFNLFNTNNKVKKTLRLKDLTAQYKIASNVGNPIHDYNSSIFTLQNVESTVYFTLPVFRTESFFGPAEGYALNLYEMTENGDKKLVMNDYIPSNTVTPFTIIGSNLFYVSYNKQSMSEYDFKVYDLQSKEQKTLQKSVDSFWLQEDLIYFTSDGMLYSMNQDGGDVKQFKSINYLYNALGFEAKSFGVTINGVLIHYNSRKGSYYYLDTMSGKSYKFPSINFYEGNQYIDYPSRSIIYTDKKGLKIYDGKTKKTILIKKTDAVAYIHQVNMETRKIQYVNDSHLYEIEF
ncbi:hypothetical protein JFL43_02595 [Viridibacillus sp. YIM B01967]|uniref:DUF5050 domain-containing protein n=1 Tax=Viridibacillus soli TaxID=2798301 RepID=A0ABS1H2W9_9BACL|nr:hypothetical protein [Viridibacillus soli]MBK3493765.1 hypothetical protein [Viridibacillus soli]